MPRLSDSMEEGTILKWLVADGAHVRRGQELVEIETDKATIVHVSEAEGALEILAPEGASLPVGAPIACVGGPVGAPANGAQTIARPEPNAAPQPLLGATPLARRAAASHDVRLEAIAGTGPRGRVTRADVLRAAGAETLAPAEATGAKGEAQRIEPTRSQQLVARRMSEAKATIPHFQVQTEVEMDTALALRAGLKASVSGDGVPSLNDLVVKACATALRHHPRANGSYRDGTFELHPRVNVGVAVAAEDALVVAVVKDADAKSLGAIARETRRLAERVRSGAIAPPELSGATFTVSNLGMFGMTAITPVINPPQAAILGVGSLRETLARVDGEIVERTRMTLTLSCDHRILYGADAARLLGEIRDLLQAPLALAL
jgi:pyruvate dehydrogenase E2 component (dihydrolipoamide acetyltransferase)